MYYKATLLHEKAKLVDPAERGALDQEVAELLRRADLKPKPPAPAGSVHPG